MEELKELKELKKALTPYNITKYCAGYIISAGAFLAIVAILKRPMGASKGLIRLLTKLGIFILACKAGDVAQKYFCDTADEVRDSIKDIKEAITDVGIE